jgi:hypothetical protein
MNDILKALLILLCVFKPLCGYGEYANRLTQPIYDVNGLFGTISYALAKPLNTTSYSAANIIRLVIDFKEHKENPDQTPIGMPIMAVLIAAGLIYFPPDFLINAHNCAFKSSGIVCNFNVGRTSGVSMPFPLCHLLDPPFFCHLNRPEVSTSNYSPVIFKWSEGPAHVCATLCLGRRSTCERHCTDVAPRLITTEPMQSSTVSYHQQLDGALTERKTTAMMTTPFALAYNLTDTRSFVIDASSNNILGCASDPETGLPQNCQDTGAVFTNPTDIAIPTLFNTAYVADQGELKSCLINEKALFSGCAVTPITGFPLKSVEFITTNMTNKILYAVMPSTGTIARCFITPNSPDLSCVNLINTGTASLHNPGKPSLDQAGASLMAVPNHHALAMCTFSDTSTMYCIDAGIDFGANVNGVTFLLGNPRQMYVTLDTVGTYTSTLLTCTFDRKTRKINSCHNATTTPITAQTRSPVMI